MKALCLTTVVLALTGSQAAGVSATTSRPAVLTLPRWLPAAERQALDTVFGGARPLHIYYASYPRKIAVIFEFAHVVVCHTCGGPTNTRIPRGKVIRVSFYRSTHRLTGSMQFCESRGMQPSRALCLHR